MANDLMIPDRAEVPAYILNPELAKQANDDAMAGISTGFPPRLKINGTKFATVDGGGEEVPYPQGKMISGPDDNLYLPLIVLRAKKELQKTWYAGAYNPKAEAQAPDCFSNDGVTPDPTASVKQCDLCANCPQNQYGTAKDAAGNPTNGKACSDSKILAVFIPNMGIHSFKVPPASLKNWALYVKNLSNAGIPLGVAKTLIGFDPTASFPVLVFKFGGYVPENTIEKLAAMAQSSEAEEIVNNQIKASAKPTLPAPAAQAAKPVVAPAPAPAAQDDLGLDTPPAEKKSAGRPKKDPAPVVNIAPAQAAPAASAEVVVEDAELKDVLGISEDDLGL